jgi:hypothetical protein
VFAAFGTEFVDFAALEVVGFEAGDAEAGGDLDLAGGGVGGHGGVAVDEVGLLDSHAGVVAAAGEDDHGAAGAEDDAAVGLTKRVSLGLTTRVSPGVRTKGGPRCRRCRPDGRSGCRPCRPGCRPGG